MMIRNAMMLGGLLATIATPVLAQNAMSAGAAEGAAAGGAVGALVGGVTGAAVGTAAGVTGAIVGAPAIEHVPPITTRRSTCVTAVDGSQRCDSVETTN